MATKKPTPRAACSTRADPGTACGAAHARTSRPAPRSSPTRSSPSTIKWSRTWRRPARGCNRTCAMRTLLVWLVPLFVIAALWARTRTAARRRRCGSLRMITAPWSVARALGRKSMFDYPEADMQTLFATARKTPEGAGRALQAMAIVIAAALLAFAGMAPR
jgi:hypothetical protein